MARLKIVLLTLALLVLPCAPLHAQPIGARAFDADWRFLRGDVAGAEMAQFPDRDWIFVDLPHD